MVKEERHFAQKKISDIMVRHARRAHVMNPPCADVSPIPTKPVLPREKWHALCCERSLRSSAIIVRLLAGYSTLSVLEPLAREKVCSFHSMEDACTLCCCVSASGFASRARHRREAHHAEPHHAVADCRVDEQEHSVA